MDKSNMDKSNMDMDESKMKNVEKKYFYNPRATFDIEGNSYDFKPQANFDQFIKPKNNNIDSDMIKLDTNNANNANNDANNDDNDDNIDVTDTDVNDDTMVGGNLLNNYEVSYYNFDNLKEPDYLINETMMNDFQKRLVKKSENIITYGININGEGETLSGSNIGSNYYELN